MTNQRLTQVLNHCQRAGIHQNPKENLKLQKYTFNLDKRQKETKKTKQKRFLYNFIDNMRLKTLSTIVNRGLWYSGGPERPKVSWKQKKFFLKNSSKE
jgi:hypothetical protein